MAVIDDRALQSNLIDPSQIIASPPFKRLAAARRRLGFGLTALVLVVYVAFFLADAWLPGTFAVSIPVFGSIGMLLIVLMFVLAWGTAWIYLHQSDHHLATLTEEVVEYTQQQKSTLKRGK